MSTLEMLLEEGYKIGTSLGKLGSTLNVIKNLPEMSAANISKILNVSISFVKEIQAAQVSKNKQHFLQIIHKELFAKVPLYEKDHSTIEKLVDDFLC